MCLSRGRGLGIDRRDIVRGEHPSREVDGATSDEQTPAVCTGGDVQGLRVLDQLVGKALFHRPVM